MGRPKGSERILGPYRDGNRWRVHVIDAEGNLDRQSFASESDARQFIETVRKLDNEAAVKSVGEALEDYELYLRGNNLKPRSIERAIKSLRLFFPKLDLQLRAVTPKLAASYYDALTVRKRSGTDRTIAVATHRNALSEVKTFLRWCVQKEWLKTNPAEVIKGRGIIRRGKTQLRIDEAMKWSKVAFALAPEEPGALAAILTFYLNLRCSEVIALRVRDVDAGGTVLWVPDSKTETGRRRLEVPKTVPVDELLLAMAAGRSGTELLFPPTRENVPGRWRREWPRKWVMRICDRAGVPRVCAHSMRGLHATLATSAGVTGEVVARAMGHASQRMTYRHYAQSEAVARGQQQRVLDELEKAARVDSEAPLKFPSHIDPKKPSRRRKSPKDKDHF